MYDFMEEIRQETERKVNIKIAMNLIAEKYAIEKIANITGLSLE